MLVYRQSAILLEKDIFLDLSVPTRFNVHMFPTGSCYLNSSHKSIILSVKTYLLPACATYSKLPSNVNTMPPMTRLLMFDPVSSDRRLILLGTLNVYLMGTFSTDPLL